MVDREVEIVEPQGGDRKEKGKKERKSKDEGRELLITLYEDRACIWDVTWRVSGALKKQATGLCCSSPTKLSQD